MTAVLEHPVPEFSIEPVYVGPTWKRGEDGEFILPQWTLAWQAIHWAKQNLNGFDGGELSLTAEQVRFLCWWYAVDERGRFVYREGVLQRLKGWGKDPIVAVIAAIEFLGPCRFAGWATKAMPEHGIQMGEPFARDNPVAWIQIAAVSQEQTKNTMKLFPLLFKASCMAEHGMNKHSIGQTVVYAHNGARQIQAVTSSPRALEGGRPTLVILNETHHWLHSNDGHEMADVIDRNSTKSKGGAARTLAITNAYAPHEDSVAKLHRETYDEQAAGLAIATGMLYDSIEAPADAGVLPPRMRQEGYTPPDPGDTEAQELEDAEIKAYLSAIVAAVRGDATWLDVEGIVAKILNKKNSVSKSRRFWFNQIVADEDAWVDHVAVDRGIDPLAKAERERTRKVEGDQLRCGWNLVSPTDPIVMVFDGSKSDDATGLVGVRLSDGYTFTIGVWQDRRKKERREATPWRVPREEVDKRVKEAFGKKDENGVFVKGRFNVVAFWGDPSHAKPDEDEINEESDVESYWRPYFDRWHREYSEEIDSRFWAIASGHRTHAIMWDMAAPSRIEQFTRAAEVVQAQIQAKDDLGDYYPTFLHDGHPALVEHLKNARRAVNKFGVSLRKEGRESEKKIDLGVLTVMGQMLARVVLNLGIKEKKVHTGVVY